MKKLILFRHAKSSWDVTTLTDFERPINERGRIDAPLMGEVLKKKEIALDGVYSSPANRAITTARIVMDKLKIPKNSISISEDLYEANWGEMIRFIGNIPDTQNNIIIFGHNTGMTELINYLTDFDLDNLPTAGIFGIELQSLTWQGLKAKSGTCFLYEYPKKQKGNDFYKIGTV